MKYYIFWTVITAAIIATFISWLHPATFSIGVLAGLWAAGFALALYTIVKSSSVLSNHSVTPERILHVSLFYPPATDTSASNIKNIVDQTFNMHEKPGIRVLTSNLNTAEDFSSINPDKLLDDPMYVQRLHHTKLPFVRTPYLQALYYYISHHNPDLIYVHGTNKQILAMAKLYGRFRNVPVVVNDQLD